uniref:Sulfhydryl oxidase n=1 Tax=Globodera pallida TaxID=36090 RepID=A0A183CB98_GLOPA
MQFSVDRKRRKCGKASDDAGPNRRRAAPLLPLVPCAFILISFLSHSLLDRRTVAAVFADQASVPMGTSPTLYDAGDFVVQLDDHSFNDTVFCTHNASSIHEERKCTAIVVEFYSDWCGHCRTYARVYKALARDLRGWDGVLKLAAINCADPINSMTCRFSKITHYPYIKYFPRNSSTTDAAETGRLLRSHQSMADMRDQITQALVAEWEESRYADWPDFEPLGEVETHNELWEGVDVHILTMKSADSLVGPQLLLDLQKHGDTFVARRCVENSLSVALQIADFPTFAVFRRGERSPVFVADSNSPTATLPRTFSRRKGNGGGAAAERMEHFCELEPEGCKKFYFVSELDMLKSVRMVAEEWEHCKGSSPILRGFTCALWMVFHSLTINAYQSSQNDERFHPIAVLHTIRDWVQDFFACEHCRVHFLRMTTKTAKIETSVHRKEDGFLYLWKAHNSVNGRLKGRETEDPNFPKFQFPPKFLCPECRRGSANEFEEEKVREFLLKYYGRVRPFM